MPKEFFLQRAAHWLRDTDTNLKLWNIKRSLEFKEFSDSVQSLQRFASNEQLFKGLEGGVVGLRGNMGFLEERSDEQARKKRIIVHLGPDGSTHETLEILYGDSNKPERFQFSFDNKRILKLEKSKEGGWTYSDPNLADTRENTPYLKKRFHSTSIELIRLVNSFIIGQYPVLGDGSSSSSHDGDYYANIIDKLSRSERISSAFVRVDTVSPDSSGRIRTETITIKNSYGDVIDRINSKEIEEDSEEALRKKKYLEHLDELIPLTRRKFLQGMGLVGLALVLAACGGKPSAPESLTDDEWNQLVESGVVERHTNTVMDLVYNDSNLTDGTKGLLYAYLGSKEGQMVMRGWWRRVATPQYLQKYGIFAGEDMRLVLQTRLVNGGFAFYDGKTGTYAKFIAADTPQGKYLRDSFPSWQKTWTVIGMPEEMVSQIRLIGASQGGGILVDGREYVVVTTPQAGISTLDSYYTKTLLPQLGQEKASLRVAQLLEEYYLNVLIPMNKQGVIQRDINWRNMVIRNENNGVQRLVPIDLDGATYMVDKQMLAQWQYDQLAERAMRRGVALPNFSEFTAKYPERFVGLSTEIDKIKAISVQVGGSPMKILIPAQYTAGMKGEAMGKLVAEVESQISKNYRAVPQGGIISFEVETATGSKTTLNIVKTTAYGDRVIGFGGKLGETVKFLSDSLKIAANVLFVLWIVNEVGQITNPDYRVSFQSGVAFPDSVVSLQKNSLSLWLNGTFDLLMGVKHRLADRATGIIDANAPEIQGIFDVDKKGLLRCMTEYGMTQADISKLLHKKADSSLFPAPSEVRFTEPFPILVSAAREPISAYFSAVTDEVGDKLMVLWAGQTDTAGKANLIPTAVFYKKKNEKDWNYRILAEGEWSVTTSLNIGKTIVLNCRSDSKGLVQGEMMKLFCEVK